ncbi:cuticle collagen 14-like [Frankliniella occidentalis]|uniref:Cuticle collagen 14-like n=1 Tax=Frankliniella occidentalis TaxID=133901 RepID=A0A9C6X136_FRAOC|nr:cuticle collagen 14-like [Frankliniella occidentalis]
MVCHPLAVQDLEETETVHAGNQQCQLKQLPGTHLEPSARVYTTHLKREMTAWTEKVLSTYIFGYQFFISPPGRAGVHLHPTRRQGRLRDPGRAPGEGERRVVGAGAPPRRGHQEPPRGAEPLPAGRRQAAARGPGQGGAAPQPGEQQRGPHDGGVGLRGRVLADAPRWVQGQRRHRAASPGGVHGVSRDAADAAPPHRAAPGRRR